MRAALLVVAACASPGATVPQIDAVTPDHAPLVGGTRVTITGRGLGADGGSSTRVFVAGREAPLAHAIDAATVEVVIPPGHAPGPAELLVVSVHGNALASDRFRYSTPPAVTAVTPDVVIYNQPTTLVVTGSGFVDEGAGPSSVLVDGAPAEEVVVVGDGELHVRVPADRALGSPRLEIANTRGVAIKDRAFRYRPTRRSGLLMFPRFGGLFAVFYDPVNNERVDIPRITGSRFTTVTIDESGEYWAHEGMRIGRIDLDRQRLEQAVSTSVRVAAMTRVGGRYYAILGRQTQGPRFGTLGLDGIFTPIGVDFPCCGAHGLAFDGTTLWLTYRNSFSFETELSSIDRDTGALGTPVKIAGSPYIEELRVFGGTLYAPTRDGRLVTLDPVTGNVTTVLNVPWVSAMEVFE